MTVTTGTERTTEQELFAGYADVMRTESCVCGGQVKAPRNDWKMIEAALRLHYLSRVHQTYRAWREAHG